MEQERELLKGSTQTLILAVLKQQPNHGYALAREIERLSDNSLKFHDGTLYPALQQLERAGLIIGAWETVETAPPRKVYRLTEAGALELQKRTETWSRFARSINTVLGLAPETRPA